MMHDHGSILVTGAAGFVGTHVVRAARDAGLRVRTHARRPTPGIDFSADLTDSAAVRGLPWDTIRAVIHCAAAIPSVSDAFARDNTRSAAVLAETLLDARLLRRIVHVSSIAVYRRPAATDWPISEEAEVVDAADKGDQSYALSKRRVEIALDGVAAQRPDVLACHLRASSIYGPGMVGTTLLPALVRRARQDQPMVLRGPRAYRQNFVHVKDVAALAITMTEERTDWSGPVLNAFSDDTCGLFELAEMVRASLGSSSPIVDETENISGPVPAFDNARAKRHHPRFRALRDHLQDIPA
jgi:nucleoside-diphosphate-sugar epimerase